MDYENVFYFKDINSIGGVETFFYYLSCKYKNMVVFYKEASPEQVERLSKNIEVRKYKGEVIRCKKFFCNYAPDIIDNVFAEEYISIIHCDYKKVKFNPIINHKFTKYIGVSQLVCDSFKERTGIEAECIYNPVAFKVPKVEKLKDNKIHLISATRLSSEKGADRIEKLSRILDRAGINYDWTIYTNRHLYFSSSNIILEKPKLDIIKEIKKSTFLVQLSSHEAYCFSVVEALKCSTPVIVTDLPIYKELGLIHGVNAIICDLSMNNVDINMIKNGLDDFKYTPPKSNWGKYLDNNSSYNPDDITNVRIAKNYTDIVLKRKVKKNDIEKMTKARASYLEAKGLVEVI